MKVIDRERLTAFGTEIFTTLGADEDKAHETVDHLVQANLKGHDSHGVGMIPGYVGGALNDRLQLNANAEVVQDKGAVLLVDGHMGFGQVVARQATDAGIARAKESGLACVGSRNNHHVGRIGTYAERCADAGLVSVFFVNVVGHGPFVSPWGGREARMQTNPFCCGVPTDDAASPIILDMATSAIALGKVRVANNKGVPVPDNCLFDAEGVPTTDPSVIGQGGSLGPFGQHKGYGLALVCELLGGGLAGEWTMQDKDRQQNYTVNNLLMFIIEPDVFGGSEAFRREVTGMSDWLHSTPPSKGNDRVRLPGEPERESMAERLANGIPVDDQSWQTITNAAVKAGMTQSRIDELTA